MLKITELKCFFCEKPGHTKRTCRNYKKWISGQNYPDNNTSNRRSENNQILGNKKESVKIIHEEQPIMDFLF